MALLSLCLDDIVQRIRAVLCGMQGLLRLLSLSCSFISVSVVAFPFRVRKKRGSGIIRGSENQGGGPEVWTDGLASDVAREGS